RALRLGTFEIAVWSSAIIGSPLRPPLAYENTKPAPIKSKLAVFDEISCFPQEAGKSSYANVLA
ncbi:MAG: hypothetical protein AAFW68_13255, partial [Pseudomonadota bacterium]